MKKLIVFSSLKIAFGILLFGVGLQANAEQEADNEFQLITDFDDIALRNTDHLPIALFEFKSGVSPDLMFNVKKTGKIQFFKEVSTHLLVGKTKGLSHNFSYCVIPSFGITEIIFPFHSFL